MRAAGGEVYAITSEPQRLADDARENWQLNFETVGDPHHEISDACRERGWLDIIVNTKTDLVRRDEEANYSHPKGYFQPGVLALNQHGRILYRWRSVPTRRNVGGAIERPTSDHVYRQLNKALNTNSAVTGCDAELDHDPVMDSRGIPWPLFVSILTANGWFIKPKPFPHKPGSPRVELRILRAILRIPVFIAAWVIALMYLPPLLVGICFTAWVLWLAPKVRYINDQFQNVKPP